MKTSNLHLLIGKDHLRKERSTNSIIKNYKIDSSQIKKINPSSLNESQVISFFDNLKSFSLFSNINYWLIDNFDECKINLQTQICSEIKNGLSNNFFIIKTSNLPKKNILYKLAEELGEIEIFENLTGVDLTRWITKELQARQLSFEEKLPIEIAKHFESDLDGINKALTHLELCSDKNKLLIKDFRYLYQETILINEFEFSDLVFTDNIKALSKLHTLINNGSNPFALIGLLNKNFYQLLQISELYQQGGTANTITEATKIPLWLVNKKIPLAKKIGPKKLKLAIELVLKADLKLKNKNLGNLVVMEQLIQELAC